MASQNERRFVHASLLAGLLFPFAFFILPPTPAPPPPLRLGLLLLIMMALASWNGLREMETKLQTYVDGREVVVVLLLMMVSVVVSLIYIFLVLFAIPPQIPQKVQFHQVDFVPPAHFSIPCIYRSLSFPQISHTTTKSPPPAPLKRSPSTHQSLLFAQSRSRRSAPDGNVSRYKSSRTKTKACGQVQVKRQKQGSRWKEQKESLKFSQ